MTSLQSSIDRHIAAVIERHPKSRTYLEHICDAWRKYRRLPKRILLNQAVHALPLDAVELFGQGALHLTKTHKLYLYPDKLFDPRDRPLFLSWLASVHTACGRPWNPQEPEDGAGEGLTEQQAQLIERWRLLNPGLAELLPFLKAKLDASAKNTASGLLLERWLAAGEIVRFLSANTEALTLSELGAQFCCNSKSLRSGGLIATVAEWLYLMDGGDPADFARLLPSQRRLLRQTTLGRHSVVENRCGSTVTLFGPFVYVKKDVRFDHGYKAWQTGESIVMTLENLDNVEECIIETDGPVITCENESPYSRLVRQAHNGLIIYTAGFPSAAACSLYRRIAESSSTMDLPRLHWGDTDPAGLRIAAILHAIAPLKLWRCGLADVQSRRERLIPLDANAKEFSKKFLQNNPDFPFRDNLLFTVENGWLEQEAFDDSGK